MTPPTRQNSQTATPTRRSFFTARSALVAFAIAAGAISLPQTADAMITPEARGSLKGLSSQQQDSLRDQVVAAGLDAIGTPYTWGGEDPDDGFDCSGLVAFVYREIAGMDLPRRARDQRAKGANVAKSKLQPGDLVFFNTRGRGAVSHVGIYIGDDKFVHAPTSGSTVRIDSLDSTYWSKVYRGARALIKPDSTPAAPKLVALTAR